MSGVFCCFHSISVIFFGAIRMPMSSAMTPPGFTDCCEASSSSARTGKPCGYWGECQVRTGCSTSKFSTNMFGASVVNTPRSDCPCATWRPGTPREHFRQRPGPVRSVLASAATGPADVAVTSQRILRQPDRSLGGRVIPPCSPLEVRRLQNLYALDEVRKAVAYALVAAGHELVAIEREQFLLHVPLAEANDQWMMEISQLAREAARPLLRYLAPTCEVRLLKES